MTTQEIGSGDIYVARVTFVETLLAESLAITGYGIYIYLSPLDIETLFNMHLNSGSPLREFVRQCVKDAQERLQMNTDLLEHLNRKLIIAQGFLELKQ